MFNDTLGLLLSEILMTSLQTLTIIYIFEYSWFWDTIETLKTESILFCILQAATQSSKLPVAALEYTAVVTGPADRRELTKEILDFCGALPIYKAENSVNPITENENGTLTLSKFWRTAIVTQLYAN